MTGSPVVCSVIIGIFSFPEVSYCAAIAARADGAALKRSIRKFKSKSLVEPV